MKISKEKLSFSEAIDREWIITNGIGGYAASTVAGINTRKYHGLLIAPLTPPARRFLILSKIDESLEIEGKEKIIYSNMCKNFIADGYKNLESFEKDIVPIFNYKVEDVSIKKTITMEYGKNTVCIHYHVETGSKDIKFKASPIINFRDFHTMSTNKSFEIKQYVNGTKVKVVLDNNSQYPIYLHSSAGEYIQYDNNIFNNMYYMEEEKRGFFPEENHIVSGTFVVDINKNSTREITIVCSLEENIEELDAIKIVKKEKERIENLLLNSQIDLNKNFSYEQKKDFIQAADNFVVYRPNFGYHTILAGYPWFLDWGRDSLISFEGLLLKNGRYDIAKQVIFTMIRDIKFGLVPNGYSGYDNRPLYNSADSSLLLFEQIYKYLRYTEDIDFIKDHLYSKLETIIENYKKKIDVDQNNIYLDTDFLISSGTENTQNTWMDAKFAGHCFTPRNGKAVEINALWYNALKIMEELTKIIKTEEDSKEYAKLASKCKKSFEEKFYNPKKKCLYDVLGDAKVRPNQLFAISLSFPVINPASEIATNILNIVKKKLLNKYGLKTLASEEKGYVDTYEGNPFRRDSSYHQGITWTWLLGLYFDALNNKLKYEKNKENKKKCQDELIEFKNKVEKTFIKEFYQRGTIGGIAEIFDSKMPYKPRGTMTQAWSVSEIIRIIF